MFESLLIASFIAGFLTVLAPCLIPLLPVVVGGSLVDGEKGRPYVVIASLLVSVILFSLIIESISSLFYVPQTVWAYISGTLILFVGIYFVFPSIWYKLPFVSKFNTSTNKLLGKGITKKKGLVRDVTIGASLGPVFTSCSPTYLLILAIVLPKSFVEGMFYLIVYAIGLGAVLLLIVLLGQVVIDKLGILAKEKGWFRLTMGIIMIVISIMIFTGLDKDFAEFLLDLGFIDVSKFELDVIE